MKSQMQRLFKITPKCTKVPCISYNFDWIKASVNFWNSANCKEFQFEWEHFERQSALEK